MANTNPRYHISCFIHPLQNLFHLGHIYVGLCSLRSQRLAIVDFIVPRNRPSHVCDPVALWAEVTDLRTRQQLRVAFELYDRSDVFAMDALTRADVYFKRNYYQPDMAKVSSELRGKIRPFGLNYPCHTAESLRATLSRVAADYGIRFLRSPLATARMIHRLDLYYFLVGPDVSAFEHAPDQPVQREVHFQTRVWDQDSLGPDSHEDVNRPRVELSRLLRRRFGALFLGGIVPSEFARRYCPNDLSNEPTRRPNYVALSKAAMIGIYTRGLHHSLAFKLGEYLASSKCIVTEPLRNELPSPLVPGKNYLEFSTPQECMQRCEQLLDDAELANQMRRNNWEYYQQEVRPDRHVLRCLERAFQPNVQTYPEKACPRNVGLACDVLV